MHFALFMALFLKVVGAVENLVPGLLFNLLGPGVPPPPVSNEHFLSDRISLGPPKLIRYRAPVPRFQAKGLGK